MTATTLQRDAFMPRNADGVGPGLLLAALVHVALLIGIAFGVKWHASEPEGIEAELWASVPQVAAQRAVEPEPVAKPVHKAEPRPEPKPEPAPPPKAEAPDPQIAVEKAKQEKLKEQKKRDEEQEKLDKKKAQDEKAQLAKAQADKQKKQEEQLAAQREANIKRILGDANATGNSAGNASQTKGSSAAYAGRIKARIKPNIVLTDSIDGNPMAEVEVRCSPDGHIVSSKLLKSSGVKEWDDAVLRAVERTEILPRDSDGSMPSPIVIAFRRQDL